MLSRIHELTDDTRAPIAAKRIRELRERLDMDRKAFGALIGVSQPQISRYEAGLAIPTSKTAIKIASAGNGNPMFYQGFDIPGLAAPQDAVRELRISGKAQAGAWRESEEEFDDDRTVALTADMGIGQYRDLHVVEVVGESMNNRYREGTLVIVAGTIANGILPQDGNVVVVRRQREDGTHEVSLKVFEKKGRRKARLVPDSDHPDFQEPLDFKTGTASFNDGNDETVTVTGIVVWDPENGSESHSIKRNTNMTRNEEVLMRSARGDSHAKIAIEMGITRQRVGAIVNSMGGDSRSEVKKVKERLRVIKGGKSDD